MMYSVIVDTLYSINVSTHVFCRSVIVSTHDVFYDSVI